MTTPTYHRARHSVSLLHAHLVFATKYPRRVFTDAMLTFCVNTMRTVCADLNVELVEFNLEADHVHLLVAYPRCRRRRSNPDVTSRGRECSADRAGTPSCRGR